MTDALPSPPFVEVLGIYNFRDIGRHDHPVRPGLVYRSADPSKATEVGLKKMSEELGKVCLCSYTRSCIFMDNN